MRHIARRHSEIGFVAVVPRMPGDAASAVGKASINNRSHSRRIAGSEGKNMRLRQYARAVEAALRPVLAGQSAPLTLACNSPLETIFRSVCGYPHVLAEGLREAVERMTPAAGAVEALMVNMDTAVPGLIDKATGEALFAKAEVPATHGVIDQIGALALNTGARVLAVRKQDIPEGAALAAVRATRCSGAEQGAEAAPCAYFAFTMPEKAAIARKLSAQPASVMT